jgi:hypothetical protein
METALAKLLNYSFSEIGWEYDKLTDVEKSLVSREEFEEIKDKYMNTSL